MNIGAEFFRLLGDTQRLRILRLLSKEKLNVSEMTEILAIAQSGISRHLRLLREAGLVREDRERGWSYYSVAPGQFSNGMSALWPALAVQLEDLDDFHEDDVRLQEVLRQRKEDFREQTPRVPSPGRSWAAWARTLSYLVPPGDVADLGCGEGYLTLEVARWARNVIAIDHSQAILDRAKRLARKYGVRNIHWKRARIEKLPIPDESIDVVLMAQVLHSLQDPGKGLSEAYRILRPEGILLFQELRSHQEEWVRTKLGDTHLGFEEKELKLLVKNAGFTGIRTDVGSKRRGDPFTVLIGCGRKKRGSAREVHRTKRKAR
jgi:ArsR family transcriptional regulator